MNRSPKSISVPNRQSSAFRRSSLVRVILSLAVLVTTNGVGHADVSDAVIEAQKNRIDVIAKVSKPTIAVFGGTDAAGGGSGVVISPDGYALTNYHVAQPSGTYMRCSMNDGKLYDAVIVSIDPTGDVALIKLLGREDFPCAEIGDSDKLKAGDWAIVAGNPFLLATDFQPTITYGIISGVHRYQYPAGTLLEYADCIQTDASINPGNSGGPLFNAEGQLVGINGRGSFEKRGRVNVGVGYAISINQIKNFMGHLKSGRIVDHATLGATVSSDEDGSVIVTNILEESDAFRRGLRYNDEIISFGGRTISTVNGFKNALGIYPKGWRVPLSYRRGDDRFDIFVRLSGVHAEEELLAKVQSSAIPSHPEPEPGKDPIPDKPEKESPDENPSEDPSDKPNGKRPRRPRFTIPKLSVAKPLPKQIDEVFEAKRGYSNYYFNLLERDRIWERFVAETKVDGLKSWTLTGTLASEDSVSIQLAENEVMAKWNDLAIKLNFDEDLNTQLDPRDSGGGLLALFAWHRMITQGPKSFGDVYYLGHVPVPGNDSPADVLVGTYDVIEARYYFDTVTGHLVLLELYPDTEVDPCELYFYDYQISDGRSWPKQIRMVLGDEEFTTIAIDQVATVPTDKSGDQK